LAAQPIPEFEMRTITTRDVKGVAAVHGRVFSEYFLTHMGQRFLECLYREFTERPGYGVVALHKDNVIGFVTGMSNTGAFYSRFYRRNFITLASVVTERFVRDRIARREILKRVLHVRNALLSLLHLGARQVTGGINISGSPTLGYILSIGIDDKFKGSGLAKRLVQQYCEELRRDGFDSVLLSVLPNNRRAIRFFEKTGWVRYQETDSSIAFIRSTLSC
jgi:ribosomal protein S18 acetylase RimI-like enzyme